MGEWISSKDRLPDAGVHVLVYHFPKVEIALIYKRTQDEIIWWSENAGVIDLYYYKWWMPLPSVEGLNNDT